MLNRLFESSTVPAVTEAIHFAQARHNVLAGNIANADTPGYRVRDLDVEAFQHALGEALSARKGRSEETSPGHFGGAPIDNLKHVRESLKNIDFHDGTNVALEQQVAEMSKNQMMHNLAITILNSQFRLLQAAITERV